MGTAWKVIPCLPVYNCWSGVQQRSCACVMSWAGAFITALCCLVFLCFERQGSMRHSAWREAHLKDACDHYSENLSIQCRVLGSPTSRSPINMWGSKKWG